MKRKIISLILLLVLCLSLPLLTYAASNDRCLFDDADLLSDQQDMALNRKLLEVSKKHNAQILVVTVGSLETIWIDDYVDQVYDTMDFGYGANRDGVLLLVCMNPREYRILSNGNAADAIDYEQMDAIGRAIVSDLSSGDYADAFTEFADQCDYYLNVPVNGFPFRFGKNLMISLIIGAVIGLIVVAVLASQLKSVRSQNQANAYVRQGSMQVTLYNDIFLYRNVTRRKREPSNSSRSGSSRRIGGGSF